jgi:undecaprenyl-diphosphatase
MVIIEELLKYDTELFQFLNGLGNTSWDGFWLLVTEKWSSIPLYMLMLYLVYRHYGLKNTVLVMISAALMIAASDQLSNLFKFGFERPRPCRVAYLEETMRFIAKRCGPYGYFSAHASSAMAAAVFLGLLFRKQYRYLPFLLLVWAVVLAYSRIYIGVHYPLDSITGMFFGGLLGWLFFLLQHWIGNRFFLTIT